MHFTQRRLSVGQLNGGDAERPDITAHVVRVIQLLLASNDLYNAAKSMPKTKTNIAGVKWLEL